MEPVDLFIPKAALITSLTPISNSFVLDELVIFLVDQEEGLGDFSVHWFVEIESVATIGVEAAEVVGVGTHVLLKRRQLRVHGVVALVLGLCRQSISDVAIFD